MGPGTIVSWFETHNATALHRFSTVIGVDHQQHQPSFPLKNNCMCIIQLNISYLEWILSARDNVTLRSAMTYKIHPSLTITNLNCIHPLHDSEIKYQSEAIPILCTMDAHGLQLGVEFSNFLDSNFLRLVNAVPQTLDSN